MVSQDSKYFVNKKLEHWLKYRDIKEKGYDFKVFQLLNPQKEELILDDGCGNGRFSLAMAGKGVKIVSLDVNKFMVQATKRRAAEIDRSIDVVIADCQNLPFRNRLFDNVLCVHNLWYIPLCDKAVNEMLRVTKDGGKLVVDQISEKFHMRHIGMHRRFLVGIRKFTKYIQSKVGREVTPEFFGTPEQFLRPFANYRTRFYSIPLPPLLYEILDVMPFSNIFKRVKSELCPFLLTEGFNQSAHRWLVICEKRKTSVREETENQKL
jgi:ubiquinone/menaquinone biosynthesis C-methylase UbiE